LPLAKGNFNYKFYSQTGKEKNSQNALRRVGKREENPQINLGAKYYKERAGRKIKSQNNTIKDKWPVLSPL
jgi:hypothetical protein